MSVPRFYVDMPLVVGEIALPDDAAHHAARVLRLLKGDAIVLFNGEGGEYHGSITHIDKRTVTIQLERFNDIDRESPLDITLVQAITSGERNSVSMLSLNTRPANTAGKVPSITHQASLLSAVWRCFNTLPNQARVMLTSSCLK